MLRKRQLLIGFLGILLPLWSGAVQAEWPEDKPIKFIIPFGPGGFDAYVRTLAPVLERILGAVVVPECPSSNKWNRSAFSLSECFAHHFHIMRRAVDSANGVSLWSFV